MLRRLISKRTVAKPSSSCRSSNRCAATVTSKQCHQQRFFASSAVTAAPTTATPIAAVPSASPSSSSAAAAQAERGGGGGAQEASSAAEQQHAASQAALFSSLYASSSAPLRPITALYGRRVYLLDQMLANIKTKTLYDSTVTTTSTISTASATNTATTKGDALGGSNSNINSYGNSKSTCSDADATGTSSAAEDDAGAMSFGGAAEPVSGGGKRQRKRHVNKYMNPAMAAERDEALARLKKKEGKEDAGAGGPSASSSAPLVSKRPAFTVKPVFRYPTLQYHGGGGGGGFGGGVGVGGMPSSLTNNRASPPSSSSSSAQTTRSSSGAAGNGSSRHNYTSMYQFQQQQSPMLNHFAPKTPQMIVFEVTEFSNQNSTTATSSSNGTSSGNSGNGNGNGAITSEGAPSSSANGLQDQHRIQVKAVHHVAVFYDGTVVGFGLDDAALKRVRAEVLDEFSDAKDEMLVADAEVIRLAARTNLCVFPAMDGDEAEMMLNGSTTTTTSSTAPSSSSSTSSAAPPSASLSPPSGSSSVSAAGTTRKFPFAASAHTSSGRHRIHSIFPTSAAAINRLAQNSAGTDISLRYRFTTVDDLILNSVSVNSGNTCSTNISNNSGSSTSNAGNGDANGAASALLDGQKKSFRASAPLSSSAAAAAVAAANGFTAVGSTPHYPIVAPPTTSYIDGTTLEAVVLSENTAAAVLPFAFCFHELVQLRAFNALVFPIHEKVSAWQRCVAETGALPMTLKEARVLKARLMRIASRQAKVTARRHRLLWEEHHSASRQVFEEAAEHFELDARDEGFRRRTEGMQGSLAYLCDQAHHQKDVLLEYVVIALIAVEVYIAIKAHAHDYDE